MPNQPIAIEVALHRPPLLDRDLAVESMPEPVDDAALRLGLDAGAVDDDAAVERAGHLVHAHAAAGGRSTPAPAVR